jgi:hypothetical protein
MTSWREKQLFEPGPLGWLVNPFYFARRGLLEELRPHFAELKGEVLDVGCGRKPYQQFIPAQRYVGVDVDTPVTRALGTVEQPHDFARYSSFGLAAVLEEAGFAVESRRKSCADFRTIVQLASGGLFKVTRTRSRPLNFAVQLALLAPVNFVGGLLARVLPRNPDLYLDNIVLARKRDASP